MTKASQYVFPLKGFHEAVSQLYPILLFSTVNLPPKFCQNPLNVFNWKILLLIPILNYSLRVVC